MLVPTGNGTFRVQAPTNPLHYAIPITATLSPAPAPTLSAWSKFRSATCCEQILGLCLFVLVTACLYVPPIVTIYYAFTDDDNECQRETPTSTAIVFQLQVWVKVIGIFSLCASTLIAALLIRPTHKQKYVETALFLIDLLFSVSWVIVGIVALATNDNNRCISEKQDIGNIALANFVLWILRLFCWAYMLLDSFLANNNS